MSNLTELLADYEARSIRLLLAGNSDLTIDAPQAALTPEFIDALKEHKTTLLLWLKMEPDRWVNHRRF